MEPNRTPPLPAELSDMTIDCLGNDVAALKACCLTCRRWLPRARYLLFKTVVLDAGNCQAFNQLLGTSPYIADLILRLDVSNLDTMSLLESMGPTADPIPTKSACVVTLVPCTAARCFKFLEELHLVGCTVPNVAAFASLFCYFPCLKTLYVHDLRLSHGGNGDDLADLNGVLPLPRMTLQSVQFSYAPRVARGFIQWLFSKSLHTQIRTLKFPILQHEDVLVANKILEDLGPRLQRLYITLGEGDGDLLPTFTGLSHCTALRTLIFTSLRLVPHVRRPLDRPRLEWVPVLLSQVYSLHLYHVSFRVRAGGASLADLHELDWARIGDVLSGERFKGLQRVSIQIVNGTSVKENIVPFIQTRMSGLEDRGITRYYHHMV
ncbi:hypothetical protein BKA93DRAFT_794788 [Sparassis latifolia]|uniref:F-box domain-containing protein n=1 Tax=Sparassis crispa TaxID=139825 RepID=A0A401GFX3_9APHY|nr:hypothetical protein SCP_0307480 [Sparassis crispa]GBE81025.1 hypothetical protein SCP_0307480 [Sparassis crispa]